MKKMKFRLDHVLRLREFDEKKAKLELGNILGRISAVKLEIEEANRLIFASNTQFNEYLSETRRVLDIRIFPYIMEGLGIKIDNLKKNLIVLYRELEVKKNNLKIAESKLKVVEKLKEKQYERFKREEDRKYRNELDDHTIMKYGENK